MLMWRLFVLLLGLVESSTPEGAPGSCALQAKTSIQKDLAEDNLPNPCPDSAPYNFEDCDVLGAVCHYTSKRRCTRWLIRIRRGRFHEITSTCSPENQWWETKVVRKKSCQHLKKCPTDMPTEGALCYVKSSETCSYTAPHCGEDVEVKANCHQGFWQVSPNIHGECPAKCPDQMPSDGGSCTEGQECDYQLTDHCDATHKFDLHVWCNHGKWVVPQIDQKPCPTEPATIPPLKTCTATLYQHAEFEGWAVDFATGSWNTKAMEKAGAKNNDASSIKVPEGCVAVLYGNSDFSGRQATFMPGSWDFPAFREKFPNDHVSAIKVFNSDKLGIRVSGGGYSDANGLYTPISEINGKPAWAKETGATKCNVVWYQGWGWGIGCDGHHRYMQKDCNGDNPIDCKNYQVRAQLSSGPVPSLSWEKTP